MSKAFQAEVASKKVFRYMKPSIRFPLHNLTTPKLPQQGFCISCKKPVRMIELPEHLMKVKYVKGEKVLVNPFPFIKDGFCPICQEKKEQTDRDEIKALLQQFCGYTVEAAEERLK